MKSALVDSEAVEVEEAVAPRRAQLLLAAPAGVMGREPVGTVVMAGPRLAVGAARPVVAGHVLACWIGQTLGRRAGEDVAQGVYLRAGLDLSRPADT